MIGWLRGTVAERGDMESIVETGGVGYLVIHSATTAAAIPQAGETAGLFIYTHCRENEITLFGFATRAEKVLFHKLIGISDIGPRKAISILSGTSPAELAAAVRQGNMALLISIPGIGKKTAERLIVELKDKVGEFVTDEPGTTQGTPATAIRNELLSVLTNLGYKPSIAERTVDRLRDRLDGSIPLQALIRDALSEIKKG